MDRSGDPAARTYTRGRTASSGSYEGFTAAESIRLAEEALDISRKPSRGGMEGHSALVHVHTLRKNLSAARVSVDQMQRMTDRLQDEGSQRRTVLFRHYVESRLGTRRDADRTWTQVEQTLKPTPVWYAESEIYHGLAQVRHGDVPSVSAQGCLPSRLSSRRNRSVSPSLIYWPTFLPDTGATTGTSSRPTRPPMPCHGTRSGDQAAPPDRGGS